MLSATARNCLVTRKGGTVDEEEIAAASRIVRKHLKRLHSRRRRELGINHSRKVALPELDGLVLPPWLPGDELNIVDGGIRLTGYYDWDGRPLPGLLWYRLLRMREESDHKQHFYRSGVPIEVSTVYLGLDLNFRPNSPPLIWETMVFIGDTMEDHFCARYGTRRAALSGHRVVCDVIRQAQRYRRYCDAIRAPRRAGAAACREEHGKISCVDYVVNMKGTNPRTFRHPSWAEL